MIHPDCLGDLLHQINIEGPSHMNMLSYLEWDNSALMQLFQTSLFLRHDTVKTPSTLFYAAFYTWFKEDEHF